jgi:hypothetical protein
MTLPSTHDDSDGPRFPSDRSERAKAMVAAGLFGGAGRGQGRKPKQNSAGQSVAELARAETGAIKRAYSDGLRSKNERTRLYAADKLLAAEREHRAEEDWPSEEDWQRMTDPEQEAAFMSALVRALEHDPAATVAILRENGMSEAIREAGLLERPGVIDSVAVESSA